MNMNTVKKMDRRRYGVMLKSGMISKTLPIAGYEVQVQ
jgi:hypothetical protein